MITVPISASSPYVKVTSYSDTSEIAKKSTVSASENRCCKLGVIKQDCECIRIFSKPSSNLGVIKSYVNFIII